MAKLRILPHRSASEHSVSWGNWWYSLASEDRHDLEDLVTGWDYATPLRFGTHFSINTAELMSSTGLDPSSIDVVVMADCSSVQQRFVSRTAITNEREGVIFLPPGAVAQEVKLSAHLVLGRAPLNPGPRVATEIGARLGSSPTVRAILEGDASRFPTEILRFSETNYGNSPWTLTTYFDDLNDSFMGTIRLLVNSEHPLGNEVIQSSSPSVAASLMRLEVTRGLIGEIARRNFHTLSAQWEEGSVGAVVDALCRFHLGLGMAKAAHYYADDPVGFDRLLHSRLPTVGEKS